MKAEGWKFPAIREAEAMFEADTAPEWAEGDVCNRCRVAFGMMTRQHHCRACGQVFCGKCSSKFCPLPKFGIEREVIEYNLRIKILIKIHSPHYIMLCPCVGTSL